MNDLVTQVGTRQEEKTQPEQTNSGKETDKEVRAVTLQGSTKANYPPSVTLKEDLAFLALPAPGVPDNALPQEPTVSSVHCPLYMLTLP